MRQLYSKNHFLTRGFIGGLYLLFLLSLNLHAQIVIVVPKSSSIDSLTSDELKKIFKGQAVGNPKPNPIQIVEYEDISDDFYRALYGQSAYAIGKYWLRLIFSGERVLVPKSFSSVNRFVDFLKKHENSIGFLPADVYNKLDPSLIRNVVIDGKKYDDPQYSLKWRY